jgi:phosphate-selective porin OprO/OprP
LSYTGFAVRDRGRHFDVPYTLDEATSSNDIMFMERASSQTIAVNIAAGDFRSAGGIRGYNDWVGGRIFRPTTGTIRSDTTTLRRAAGTAFRASPPTATPFPRST